MKIIPLLPRHQEPPAPERTRPARVTETAGQPVLARPYAPAPESRPAVPAQPNPAAGTALVLYTRPGWTRALSATRIRSGEWADWPALIEQGLGRNIADEATSYRHNVQRTAEAWRRFCLAAGHPEWLAPGLRRIGEFVTQLAEQAQREARAS